MRKLPYEGLIQQSKKFALLHTAKWAQKWSYSNRQNYWINIEYAQLQDGAMAVLAYALSSRLICMSIILWM